MYEQINLQDCVFLLPNRIRPELDSKLFLNNDRRLRTYSKFEIFSLAKSKVLTIAMNYGCHEIPCFKIFHLELIMRVIIEGMNIYLRILAAKEISF